MRSPTSMVVFQWSCLCFHHPSVRIVVALPVILVVDNLTLVVLQLVKGIPLHACLRPTFTTVHRCILSSRHLCVNSLRASECVRVVLESVDLTKKSLLSAHCWLILPISTSSGSLGFLGASICVMTLLMARKTDNTLVCEAILGVLGLDSFQLS